MFMIVKYGDGKEQFFNTVCKTRLLLECIKEKCDSFSDGLIDLADEDGRIMFLQERAEHYSNEFLKPRGIYVLVRRENCDRNYPNYTPLLRDDSIINENFLQQLREIREEAIKREECPKTVETGKVPQAKGRTNVAKRMNGKEANLNYKRAQSLLVSNGKKMSKGRPSR